MIMNDGDSRKSMDASKGIFYSVSKRINEYLKEDGITLNFEGYTSTINDYVSTFSEDFYSLSILMKDLLLWSNYMGELEGLIELKMLKYENMYLYLQGFTTKKFPNLEVEKQLDGIFKKYKDFKLYLKLVENQKKLFMSAYKHCVNQYNNSLEQLMYKSN